MGGDSGLSLCYGINSVFYVFLTTFCSFRKKYSSYIWLAPIVYVEGNFYVIGGYAGSASKTIAKLDSTSHEWSKSGDLQVGRYAHNAVFDGSDIIVVGGSTEHKTEKCSLSDGQVTCVEQAPSLTDYAYYPELFLIEEGFCKDWPSI